MNDAMAILESAKSFYTDCFTWLLWALGASAALVGVVVPYFAQRDQRKLLAAEKTQLRDDLLKELTDSAKSAIEQERAILRTEITNEVSGYIAEIAKGLTVTNVFVLTYIARHAEKHEYAASAIICMTVLLGIYVRESEHGQVFQWFTKLQLMLNSVDSANLEKLQEAEYSEILTGTIDSLAKANTRGLYDLQLSTLRTFSKKLFGEAKLT